MDSKRPCTESQGTWWGGEGGKLSLHGIMQKSLTQIIQDNNHNVADTSFC